MSEVLNEQLADLRLDQLLDDLCQEAERIQFSERDAAELLWEAARRLETIQREMRLFDRIVSGR